MSFEGEPWRTKSGLYIAECSTWLAAGRVLAARASDLDVDNSMGQRRQNWKILQGNRFWFGKVMWPASPVVLS